jgi:hypothetical protein
MIATIREGEPARNNRERGAGVHQEGSVITIDIGRGIRVEVPLYLKKRHNYRYRERYKGIRVVIPIRCSRISLAFDFNVRYIVH